MNLARRPHLLYLLLIPGWGCSDVTGPASSPVIVFDWLRNENRDIYRATLEGAEPLRLTSDPGDDQRPTVGGGLVVFTSYRDGNGELYSMPLTGGPARRLTMTAENEIQAALSRDGSHLAFISDVSGTPKLWMSSTDGTGAQRITGSFAFPGAPEASPAWAPKGDRLVFVGTSNGTADLFVVTPGDPPAILVGGPGAEVEPAWSPNGNEVVFVSDRDGDSEIYVVKVQSGEIRRLTNRPGIDGQPTWLPDGRLVYTAWVDGVQRLRWMDPGTLEQSSDVNLGAPGGVAQHAAAIF